MIRHCNLLLLVYFLYTDSEMGPCISVKGTGILAESEKMKWLAFILGERTADNIYFLLSSSSDIRFEPEEDYM